MRTINVLNLGAGVQSTTLYLMSHFQDEPEFVPQFDYAIFADTQEEPKAVYEHLAWLKSLGGPPILERTFGKLGDDLIRGHHQVVRKETAKCRPGEVIDQCFNIPAFLKQPDGGSIGIVRRKCTDAYKVQVIQRAIRRDILGLAPGQRVPKDFEVIQYFGLSFDEPERIVKSQAIARGKWYEPRFPLFDLEMTRADCLAYLREVAPDRIVPRSACVFCPYHSNAEWRRLRDTDPEGWSRSIEIDEAIRQEGAACGNDLKGKQYLHRSCVPLRDAPIDTPESRGEQHVFGFAQKCEGMCGL